MAIRRMKKRAKQTVSRKRGRSLDSSLKAQLRGDELRKVQPKLRMIANGSSRVNALRAERSSCVAVTSKAPTPSGRRVAGDSAIPISALQLRPSETRGKQRRLADDILVNVFVQATDRKGPVRGKKDKTQAKHGLATATVKLSELASLSQRPDVAH